MPSNAQRGAYYKGRTKKWLAGQGWQVANLEEVRWVYRPGRPPMPVKRDQFGADLIAMSAAGIIFVQVKSGAIGGTFPDARRKFGAFTFPAATYRSTGTAVVRRWVVAWAPRSRSPRVVEC
jgi:hypothetical protein